MYFCTMDRGVNDMTFEGESSSMKHLTAEQLAAGLDDIRKSPSDKGVLKLIVRRPETDRREVLSEGTLDPAFGLAGDNWLARGSRSTADGSADPEMQLNIMNARVIALVAQDPERWALAGDQLFIDMDLSPDNLPPGTRLSIGSAIIEVTPPPHTGCRKFVARFGKDAMVFVNSGIGKQLNLRGVNAKVIQAGTVRTNDVAEKLPG